MFVSGSIGIEIIGGRYLNYYNERDFTFGLLTSVEELLEMMGIVIFVYALIRYMHSHVTNIQLKVFDKKNIFDSYNLSQKVK